MGPRNIRSNVSCLSEVVMEEDNEKGPMAVMKGGKPREKAMLGIWSELVNPFNYEGGFHLLSNIREDLQSP